MEFYTSIARYYDSIFPLDEAVVRFVLDNSPEKKRSFLDVGCATGKLVLSLSDQYETCTGIDLDEELIALANAGNPCKKAVFMIRNMLNIDELRPGGFSLIACLGNTVPHLNGIGEIRDFMNKTYSCLGERGVFLMQIINYDRIIGNNIDSLPTLENDEIRFQRNYSPQKANEKIDFRTVLTDKKKNITIANSIELYPLRSRELSGILGTAGFAGIELYGSYTGAKYAADSFLLIAVCRKN